ncbi:MULTISPECIES: lipopolysaccharide assembly protein LapB [unclassified Treponema]|uniref:tetratricopeptide repeat protein n=1 Tax=unclassified Treponema TaxID=2638727 RepID=UPI0020A40E9E|nr:MULTISPECIES: tetratricopeptide repeat protein [unclassified Treponema]UTC65869.1 tetratricopeptide repeat protein [Treponema sp. OMZ 789]UTC68597.1 tetratricopeptide repeat protein [Treponema sp. OMZ 790]UTC71327.1 tetratricopeptide repeat protein [Treponema sp. OMZ 791]
MLSVFLEIVYERQLRKIDLKTLTSFIDLIKEEALSNGAEFFQVQSGSYFLFKKKSVAYVFSAARFLYNLNKILVSYKSKISEVRCITDCYEEEVSNEFLLESVSLYKKKLIPEEGLFVSTSASIKLSKYIDFNTAAAVADSSIFICDKFKFFENITNTQDKNIDKSASIIVHRNDSYFWALYNFILANPLDETCLEAMSAEDKNSFLSTKNVYTYLKKYRFSKEMPQYFIDAFLTNSSIFLKNYIKSKKLKYIKVFIDNTNDKKNIEEVEKIYAVNKYINIQPLDAGLPSIYNIPDDLLHLIYIILSSSKYFFYDEITDFLLSLNKSKNFFDDVYNWMYSMGLILLENNIYAVPYGLLEIIERRITLNKNIIDEHIAEFLWAKYKKGIISANAEAEKIFESLNFKCKPDFLLASIFHNYSDSSVEGLDLKKYKNEIFYDALKYYQNSIIANMDDSTSKSYALIKTAISFFQENKLESGEYRAFSLLALFHLTQNKISDAITYFSYALDNAEQSHDTSFICDALFNISVIYFLQNNLKQSMTFLDRLACAVDEYFEQEWKIPYLFMKGRVYLQIGEFNNAAESFKLAADFANLYFDKLEALCRAWYGRSLVYMGQIKSAQDILVKYVDYTDDASLFLLESFLFYPVLHNDLEKMDLDVSSLYDEPFNSGFAEFKNVKSGFSFVEDLVWFKIYNMSTGKKIFNAFYDYYSCKINFSEMYDLEKCKVFLSNLEVSAVESLYQNDPYSSLYMYLCYDLSVRLYGDNSSQTIAYLSKAFKSMQKNVLAIGENDIRDKYMQNNLWNSKLFTVAKNQKLI